MGVADDIITPCFRTPHDIAQAEIHAICALKNQSWPHSIESQLAWWEKNTAGDDVFVTLVREREIIAFLRLRNRIVVVSGIRKEALCVTEVCVDKAHRGRGLGSRLMGAAVDHIANTGSGVAYLLCRDAQEPFYAACGWRRVDRPLQIESASGRGRRVLADDERCMTFDPQNRLGGQIILFGDVF